MTVALASFPRSELVPALDGAVTQRSASPGWAYPSRMATSRHLGVDHPGVAHLVYLVYPVKVPAPTDVWICRRTIEMGRFRHERCAVRHQLRVRSDHEGRHHERRRLPARGCRDRGGSPLAKHRGIIGWGDRRCDNPSTTSITVVTVPSPRRATTTTWPHSSTSRRSRRTTASR
jgi:hypothetical protein